MKNTYRTLIIYYFSGTGNAKASAIWFAEKAESMGLNTQIINIDNFSKIEIPKFTGKALIGFGGPTHGFNLSPILLKFILKFPKSIPADVFLFNTRAGMKLHKLFLPGLSGIALYFSALVLRLKKYKIRGWRSIDLPSNWISVHPGIKEKIIGSIFEKWEIKSKLFIETLLKGERRFPNFWIELPFNLLVSPISIAYYFFGRFGLSKTFIANYNCNTCGLCVKECPTNSIKLVFNRPYWKFTCESCMRCMNNCPKRAIETPHLQIIGLWYILFTIIPVPIIGFLKSLHLESKFQVEIYYYILYISILALLIFLSYYLMHYLLRFKFFSKLFTKTSLTHYKFWRRYTYALKRKK